MTEMEPSVTLLVGLQIGLALEITGEIIQKLKINLTHVPAICPNDWTSYIIDTCSARLTANPWTRSRKWKQA